MFQYFHLCDHAIQAKETEPHIREIKVTNSGDDVDVVFDGGIVVGIKSVRVLTHKRRVTRDNFLYDNVSSDQRYEDRDEGDGYYDGSNYYFVNFADFFTKGATISNPIPSEYYRPFLHNRIKWLVEPPITYIVEAIVQFSHRKTTNYSLSDCPQCQGKGWFVDILNTKGRFSTDTGVMKIAQRVIKDLLTELHSSVLNLQYGTILKQSIAGVVKEDEAIFDDIRLIVSEVEDAYLLRQQEEYQSLAQDERLVKLWVKNIRRSPSNVRKLVLELQIETEESIETFRFAI